MVSLGYRHVQFLLLFFATLICYGIRTNMSVGILAMVSKTPPNSDIPTFPDWDTTTTGNILSAFFWGYIVPQVLAGRLAEKYGPKWLLLGTTFINCLFTLLIPVMALEFGAAGVMSCRVLQGLSQGFLYPSIHNLLGKWTPSEEKSLIASFVYCGGPLGTAVSLLVTGAMSESSSGWPSAFYLYGVLGIIWCVLWGLLGSNSPGSHPDISEEEKKYIEAGQNGHVGQDVPTPWGKIVKSLPCWAILVSHIGMSWGFWTLMTEIPTYMSNIMNFKLSENGALSALPYFALFLLNFVFSAISDFLISRGYLSTKTVRKIMNSIGFYIPAIALLVLGFVPSDQKTLAVALLVIAVGVNSAVYSGFNLNHIDIAPNHAGLLMGITNSVSNVFSIIAPKVVSFLGMEETNPVLWQIVFGIAAVVNIVTNTFFVIFADGEVQSWNDAVIVIERPMKY